MPHIQTHNKEVADSVFHYVNSAAYGASIFAGLGEFMNSQAGLMIMGTILSIGANMFLRWLEKKSREGGENGG